MTSLRGKHAVVTGGSSGVGKATVRALLEGGARVTAIARGAEGLRALGAHEGLVTLQGDAADPAVSAHAICELRPDLVVLAAGITPQMGAVDELEWDAFSETWNTDLKASFHFVKHALTLPLAPGSTVILVSSAAARGSPLSGGYAGAKRMQWLLAGYAQKVSDAKKLGLRMLTVVPEQLIANTRIAARAAAAYGAPNGLSAEAFMRRYETPLEVEHVAAAIVDAARGEVAGGIALGVRGHGVEPVT